MWRVTKRDRTLATEYVTTKQLYISFYFPLCPLQIKNVMRMNPWNIMSWNTVLILELNFAPVCSNLFLCYILDTWYCAWSIWNILKIFGYYEYFIFIKFSNEWERWILNLITWIVSWYKCEIHCLLSILQHRLLSPGNNSSR